jgi:MFS family permease
MLPYDIPARRLGVFAFLAGFCEALSFYAAALYAYALTGSVIAVSVVMAAVAGAEIVGSLIGGALADQLDRKRVASFGALAGGLLLLVLVTGANVVLLVAVMVAATLAASPIRPVVGAALPNLVIEGGLEFATGYVQALRNASLTVAPIAAGFGVGWIGPRGLFAAAAISLLVASGVLAVVRGEFYDTDAPEMEAAARGPMAGLRVIVNDRVLLVTVAAGAMAWLVAACTSIADLPFAVHDLHIGQTGYGILVATWGIGSTAGALVSSRLVIRYGAPRCFAVATFGEGIILSLVAAAGSVGLVAAAFVTSGVLSGIAAAADQLLVQLRAPDQVRARVRAASDAIMTTGYAVSLGAGGFVVAALGARGTYLIAGIGVAVAGAAATAVFAPAAARPWVGE